FMLAWAKHQTAHHTPIQGVEGDTIQAHQARGACVVAHTAAWAELGAGFTTLRLDRLTSLYRLGPGTDRQLRAESELQARLIVHPMVGGVGVRHALTPTPSGDPRRRLVEGALCRSQCRVMAVNVQLDTDGASECFVHTGTCSTPVARNGKGSGASSPCL